MTNSVELQVICRLLTTQDASEVDRLCSFDDSYYSVFKDQINFILEHREKYGDVPDLFTFQAQFEDVVIVEVNEPIAYLEDQLRKNKQHILFLQTFNKLTDLGSADVSEAWAYLQSQCEKAASLDSSNPVNIVTEAFKRSDEIIAFNKQKRIPTGFKELDKVMYGGLSTVEELCLIVARTNTGKAQPLWSNVLTPTGWKLMKDIKIGDVVCGKNNDNGKVVQIFPQGVKKYYRVNFDDNTYTECCGDHLWEVLDSKRRERSNKNYGMHLVETTDTIASSLNRRFSVDMCGKIDFVSNFNKDEELDGYLLGVILGDGSTRDDCVSISNENSQIWGRVEEALEKHHCHRSSKSKDYIVGDNGKNFVRTKIIEYGLMDVKSIDKFIPKKYFYAPVDVRLALLSGLVDTDGYSPKETTSVWEFDTSSEQLAVDFARLARSLGVKVKIHDRQKTSYTSKDAKHDGNGSRHLVCRSSFNPFYVSEKADRFSIRPEPLNGTMPKRLCKMIQSVEYVGETECQCIMVDNNSHTYITDDFVVTHNTWVTTKLMESAQLNGFPVLYYSPEMQSSFIGTRFDTWRGHFKNSELQRGMYNEEYFNYLKKLVTEETGALVVEDKDMSEGKTTVRAMENLVKKHHIKLLIIDGLSYMCDTERADSDVMRYKNICNGLFRLSKTYGCAVVVSVQANRETKGNTDEKGVPFPDLTNIEGSDHPGRIATQVFALRQLFEEHTLEIKLLKSRNAKNTNQTFAYVWDPNTGSTEYISDSSDSDSPPPPPSAPSQLPKLSTPTVSAKIVHNEPDESLISDDDDDLDDVEF